MLDSNYDKIVVRAFYLTVHRFHVGVQSSTWTTYSKCLLDSMMALLTAKLGINLIENMIFVES